MICCISDKCVNREVTREIHGQREDLYLNILLQEPCQNNLNLSMRVNFICISSADSDYFDPTPVQDGCTLIFKLYTAIGCLSEKPTDKYVFNPTQVYIFNCHIYLFKIHFDKNFKHLKTSVLSYI